ncbi:MAG: hypothetical protein GF308_15740 [Candidatus Heimdallarchaeota archaeon]|nr:hypothetical protein [Candidatus Heimdallarchaeota archaeon]
MQFIKDFDQEEFSPDRLTIGYSSIPGEKKAVRGSNEDFTEKEMVEQVQTRIVSFEDHEQVVKPIRTKIQLGGFITHDNLQEILKKEYKDRSFYRVLENIRKNDRETNALRQDFELLMDFFPYDIVKEVEDYCERLFPKLKLLVEEKGLDWKFTPRNRRAIILAVFRSVCRKNGRRFTEELVEEINNRFGYIRKIKLFEICTFEHQLIDFNLLKRATPPSKQKLKMFFLHAVKHLNRLQEQPAIKMDEQQQQIITQVRKHVLGFSSKTKKEGLTQILRSKDVDFAARLIIWSIARYFAEHSFDLSFSSPEPLSGWRTLFLLEETPSHEPQQPEEELTVRTWNYIVWAEFSIRNELVEAELFPSPKEN